MGLLLASLPLYVGIDLSAPRRRWRLSKARHGSTSTGYEPTSIARPVRMRRRVAEERLGRQQQGLIDTSVVIDLDHLDPDHLPRELAVSALTMAELTAGPHATTDSAERAARQDRLQRAEATFDPLPFDIAAARAYGRIYAAIAATGRKARGPRAVDLLIAATALAANLPLFTRNANDFRGIEHLVDIVAV
jgi:predicted nucleic acid-binding protein